MRLHANFLCRPGASARAALDKIQADIIATRAAISELDSMPRDEAEVREALLTAIRAAMAAESPDQILATFCNPKGVPVFPQREVLQFPITVAVADGLGAATVPVYAGFNLSALIAHQAYMEGEATLADRYVARLKAAGMVGSVSAEQRKSRLSKLHTRFRELEVNEERAILALEAVGHAVLRREDVSPEILLSVWAEGDQPAPAQAASRGAR